MPKRSSIETLPAKVREQLERALIDANFSGYRELAAWLKTQNVNVSKSSLQRYGATFEGRVNAIKVATDQARAVVEATPDDDNAMNDALIRLVQERVFSLLVDANTEDLPAAVLAKVTKAIADVGRASVQQKKYQAEVRAQLAAAADDMKRIAERGGVSDEVADSMIKRMMGIQT